MTLTFSGSAVIPYADTIKPKKSTLDCIKEHFLRLTYNFASLRVSKPVKDDPNALLWIYCRSNSTQLNSTKPLSQEFGIGYMDSLSPF